MTVSVLCDDCRFDSPFVKLVANKIDMPRSPYQQFKRNVPPTNPYNFHNFVQAHAKMCDIAIDVLGFLG